MMLNKTLKMIKIIIFGNLTDQLPFSARTDPTLNSERKTFCDFCSMLIANQISVHEISSHISRLGISLIW